MKLQCGRHNIYPAFGTGAYRGCGVSHNLLWKKGKEKIKNLSLNLEKEKPTEVGPASRSFVQLGKVKVK